MKPLRSMKVFLFSYLLFISGAISTSNVAYAQGGLDRNSGHPALRSTRGHGVTR
jgi:hypothetical protein